MTTEEKIKLLQLRQRKMLENGKNFKSPGALRKVARQIRNYEKRNSIEN